MQEPLKAWNRHDPPGADLHSWREPTGSGETVQGVGVQAQPLSRLRDRDEVGNHRLWNWIPGYDPSATSEVRPGDEDTIFRVVDLQDSFHTRKRSAKLPGWRGVLDR